MRNSNILPILLILLVFSTSNLFATSYSDDGISRAQALRYLAAQLFNTTMISVDDPSLGINYTYNDWGANPGNICNGYDGGHSGVDLQTKDAAGAATADRDFYSLTAGEVISAGGDDYNTIAIYDSGDDKTTLYIHGRDVYVNIGDTVEPGDKLGEQGNLGLGYANATTAEHVHVEVREGYRTGSACGASTTINPVDYLYSESRELLERRLAASVLPPLMTSSNSYLKCNGDFHVEFEVLSYSPMKDLSFIVTLRDTSLTEVKQEAIPDSSISSSGSGTYVLHTGGVSQNKFKVEYDISLTASQRDELEPNMFYRVYAKNKNMQTTLPTVRGFNWNTNFTLFIPSIISANMHESNSAYDGTNQDYTQRYIKVSTSNCYN